MKFAPLLTDGQKIRLMGSTPFQDDLFDPDLLEEVIREYQNSQATASHISVSKAVAKGLLFSNKRKREDPKPQQNRTNNPPTKTLKKDKTQEEYEIPPKNYQSRNKNNQRDQRPPKGKGKGKGQGFRP